MIKITLCLPLGYSAVHQATALGTARYLVRRGTTEIGNLTFDYETGIYNWIPRKGRKVLGITDPKEIPYS